MDEQSPFNWRHFEADIATNDSWRVDETDVKVKQVWMYLYRAVDSQGTTLEFLLTATCSKIELSLNSSFLALKEDSRNAGTIPVHHVR